MLQQIFTLIVFLLGLYLGHGSACRWYNELQSASGKARRAEIKTYKTGRVSGLAQGQNVHDAYVGGQQSVLDGGPLEDDDDEDVDKEMGFGTKH